MTDDREERIRRRAHELWQQEGSPEGREADHWQQAEREMDDEATGEENAPAEPAQPKDRTPKATKS